MKLFRFIMKLFRFTKPKQDYCIITCELYTRFGCYQCSLRTNLSDSKYEHRMIQYLIGQHHLNRSSDLYGVKFTKSYDL